MSTVLVTGSSGHLGEALVKRLQGNVTVRGLDIKPSDTTTHTGSIADPAVVAECMVGVSTVYHTATLHKPHVVTHSRQQFVDTNITGTLNVLEAALAQGVESFVFTSTTSAFGSSLRPTVEQPSAWISETVRSIPKNIYGATKTAAEDLCELFNNFYGLPSIALRTSRFFAEEDDNPDLRARFADGNIKANEYLNRRVDIGDVVDAHLLAAEKVNSLGFERLVISATTPFEPQDLKRLRTDAPGVLAQRVPEYLEIYRQLGWEMFPQLDRVYVNARARQILGWRPRIDFRWVLGELTAGRDPSSETARAVGAKGYHDQEFEVGPYPVD